MSEDSRRAGVSADVKPKNERISKNLSLCAAYAVRDVRSSYKEDGNRLQSPAGRSLWACRGVNDPCTGLDLNQYSGGRDHISTNITGSEMQTTSISSFKDLLTLDSDLKRTGRWCFRGQSNASWDLVPTIYRPLVSADPPMELLDGDRIGQIERDILRAFHRQGRQWFEKLRDNPWEEQCAAQHIGAPTRLLDWTRSILVAAYFAVGDPQPQDAAVWCLDLTGLPVPQGMPRQLDEGGHRLESVQKYCDGSLPAFLREFSGDPRRSPAPSPAFFVFEPPALLSRITTQAALLSVYVSFSDNDFVQNVSQFLQAHEAGTGRTLLRKIVIPRAFMDDLRKNLEESGINFLYLFPSQHGLGMSLMSSNRSRMQLYLQTRLRGNPADK